MVKSKIGMRSGRLVVVSFAERNKGRTYWNCICDCGQIVVVRGDKLITGKKKSCGCLHVTRIKPLTRSKRNTHHMSKTRFYTIWRGMRARCLNPKNKDFKNYGERGITVCDSWAEFENFKNDMYESYLEHISEFGEKDTTIERIDSNSGYSLKNCTWATQIEQQKNRTNNRHVEWNGKDYIVSDLARLYNLSPKTLLNRLNCGWEVQKALTRPLKKYKKKA